MVPELPEVWGLGFGMCGLFLDWMFCCFITSEFSFVSAVPAVPVVRFEPLFCKSAILITFLEWLIVYSAVLDGYWFWTTKLQPVISYLAYGSTLFYY